MKYKFLNQNKKSLCSKICRLGFWGGGILLICFVPLAGYAAFTYTPMEEIPGFGRPSDFIQYIMAIYRFGLWTIGIAALLMITIGGFMYITSAANKNNAAKAKGIITDAIVGVILAMTSYILLYTINPDLIRIQPLPLIGGGTGAAGVPGTPTGPGGTSPGSQKACPDPNSTSPIDYSKAKDDPAIKPDSECDKYDNLFVKYGTGGVESCLLKAMAQMESSCGRNKGPSSSGACGLMQILPSTAGTSCDQLKSDDDFSVKKAAELIRTSFNSSCVSAADNKYSAIFAGYNSGYNCGSAACPVNKKHSLCGSGDCQGALAFECCKNPGGLSESINYAWNGMGLYNKCKL